MNPTPNQITECDDDKQLCEWVSVEDGLPEMEVDMLTYDVNFPDDGCTVEQLIGEDDWPVSYSVTHWMPLPKPPFYVRKEIDMSPIIKLRADLTDAENKLYFKDAEIGRLQRQNDELVARVAELSDLCRFMCQTWTAIDKFVYENCDGDALMKYPVIQGTQNQFDLNKIGDQPFDRKNSKAGADYLLHQQSTKASSLN